ncbi:MAG: hypothetical protein ACR2IH_14190 [Pyrinomonadaceae bacterium]
MRTLTLKTFPVLALLIAIAVATGIASAQTASPMSISETIRRAAEQRAAYLTEFKNLISREVKSYEIYDKKESIKKDRKITSVFIVYQLSKTKDRAVEFRSVVEVDGKPIPDAEKRSSVFFTEVVAAQNSQKELQKLQDETSRYDLDPVIDGLTLNQAVALADNMQPYFSFTPAGTETVDGRETIVVAYEQTKASPFVLAKSSAESPDGKLAVKYDVNYSGDVNPRLRGKLWLDAATMQVRREVRQFTIQPEKFASPVVYVEDDLDYTSSDFSILTPKRVVHIQNTIKSKDMTVTKNAKITFDYGKFTRPDVDVKVIEETPGGTN